MGLRFMSTLVRGFQRGDPLVTAIWRDDLEFIQEPRLEEDNYLFCFEGACLCASERIALFLVPHDPQKAESAIAYALSAGNMAFTLKLAKLMKERGCGTNAIPPLLYAFGNWSQFDKVAAFFTE
jgi:hypothetical protein